MRLEVVDAIAGWFERYAIVGQKVGAKRTRSISWWALALRRKLNTPEITAAEVEAAAARVARIRVDPASGATNLAASLTLSMCDGGAR